MDISLYGWELVLAFILAFGGSVLLGHIAVPMLRRLKIGQKVFEEYIAEHKDKNGTPTMGGVSFILAFLLLALPLTVILRVGNAPGVVSFALAVALGVANALIGFVDDYCKLCRNRHEGLRSWQKFLLQVAVAVAYIAAMHRLVGLDRIVSLPLFNLSLNLGAAYDPLAVLVIVGVVNAANLTDGIDGLASSLCTVAAGALTLLGCILGCGEGALASVLLLGCVAGFLVYNYHPARVFMGDTGSLFIGGMLVGIGFLMDAVLPTLLVSGVFILDMLTSLLQIISIRIFRRKLFSIAPVHHAFQKEKWGWSEEKIVFVFTAAGLLFGVVVLLCRVMPFL